MPISVLVSCACWCVINVEPTPPWCGAFIRRAILKRPRGLQCWSLQRRKWSAWKCWKLHQLIFLRPSETTGATNAIHSTTGSPHQIAVCCARFRSYLSLCTALDGYTNSCCWLLNKSSFMISSFSYHIYPKNVGKWYGWFTIPKNIAKANGSSLSCQFAPPRRSDTLWASVCGSPSGFPWAGCQQLPRAAGCSSQCCDREWWTMQPLGISQQLFINHQVGGEIFYIYPDAPCVEYLPTFGLVFGVNVGKYSIHGASGIYIYIYVGYLGAPK